jgi:hypothetical protein
MDAQRIHRALLCSEKGASCFFLGPWHFETAAKSAGGRALRFVVGIVQRLIN